MHYPALVGGDLYHFMSAFWGSLYAARLTNLGATATIIPLGDPREGKINATTFTTRAGASGSAQTATWTTAPSGLATPYKLEPAVKFTDAGLHGPAGIPGVIFNGTSESLSIPDATYWTRLAASAGSWAAWIVDTDSAASRDIFDKYDNADQREWVLQVDADDKLNLYMYDETADAAIFRTSDAVVSPGVPLHVCATYDGATDANATVLYVNGVAFASTAGSSGVFVTMRNTTSLVTVGAAITPASYFTGTIFGGPLGPAYVQAQLTATQVAEDYKLGRYALGLG